MAARNLSALVGAVALGAGSAFGQSFTEHFDDITMLTGWDMVNVSMPIGVIGWFQGNTAVFVAQSTAGYIGANYNSAANGPSGDGTQNNWLLLPVTTLNNGDTLAFYTRTVIGGPFADRLQVRMNSNGNSINVGASTVDGADVGDFTTLLLDINPTLLAGPTYPNDWTQFTVNLSGLPAGGVSARLAFRYFVTHGGPSGVNGDYIGIDEVVYTASTGGGGGCYANCDSSTTPPCLNVNDFSCFLNKFASGDSYANCDASTTPPVLNVNDFSCFLNKFAAGCSGC